MKPSAIEALEFKRMNILSKKLEEGGASQKERDEAQSFTLQLLSAVFSEGVVMEAECLKRQKCMGGWNVTKTIGVLGTALMFCGTLVGIVIKLMP